MTIPADLIPSERDVDLLDPTLRRYMRASFGSPDLIVQLRNNSEESATATWQPALRRFECVVDSERPEFLLEFKAALRSALKTHPTEATQILLLAESARAQELLRHLPARPSVQLTFRRRGVEGFPVTRRKEVRSLEPTDATAIIDEYADEFRSAAVLFRRHVLSSPSPNVHCLASLDESGRIAGVCFAHSSDPFPEVIYLHTVGDVRRKGHGSALLQTAAEWAFQQQVATFYYVTSGSNSAAIKLCASLGFSQFGRVEGYRLRTDDFIGVEES